jgi:hypothetical protein
MTTPSFNPIIRVDEVLPWWMFSRRPVPTLNTALVLIRNGQPEIALTAGGQSTLSWREWSRYESMVWVDISERLLQFECQLPTKSFGLDFQASASITYKVNDPLEIVRWRITNPRAEIETQATQRMHEISRQHTMFECAAAEKEMRDAILKDLTSGDVVVTRCIITLDVEQEEREYARKERAAERNYLYSVQNAAYRKKVDPLDAELNQNMVAFYNNLAQPGYAQFLLLHLASNRDQVQLVLEELNKQRQMDRDHWLKMLETLRQNGALEPSDWATLRKAVIERLVELAPNNTINSSTPLPNAASVGGGSSPKPSTPPSGGSGGPSPSAGPTPAKPVQSGPSGGGPTAANPTIKGSVKSGAASATQPANVVAQPAQSPSAKERAVGDPNSSATPPSP